MLFVPLYSKGIAHANYLQQIKAWNVVVTNGTPLGAMDIL